MIKYATLALSVILMLTSALSTGYAQETAEFAQDFQDDVYLAFVSNPPDSEKVFRKYSEDFNREFNAILTNSDGHEKALINAIILICAINKNRALFEQINRVYIHHPTFFERATKFYYFRINHEQDTNLKYLIAEFDTLLKNPTDSYLIVYLPFLNDVDLSLHYLRKLSNVADGAMAELVWWSANYLYFMNQGNKVALAKIKDSSIYYRFIKNN